MITSKVKEIMEKQAVTVRSLAERTGLALETIMRARGPMIGRCTMDTLSIIAEALGVKTKNLYDE